MYIFQDEDDLSGAGQQTDLIYEITPILRVIGLSLK